MIIVVGGVTYDTEIHPSLPGKPLTFQTRLTQILDLSPNPAKDEVLLTYHLPAASDVIITLLDASGRTLETLREGRLPAGDHACL